MEIILYIYFGINLILIGGYLLDYFNDDKISNKIFSFFLLLFFGVYLYIYEIYLKDKVITVHKKVEKHLKFIKKKYGR